MRVTVKRIRMPGTRRKNTLALVAAGLLGPSAAAGAGAPPTLIDGRALTASPSGVVGAGRVASASTAGASPAWLAPVSLSVAGSSGRPRVALDPAGDAVVVFEHFRGGRTPAPRATVQAVVRPAGGGFSAPLDVSLPSEDIALFPDVAIDQAGDAIAVWQRSDGDSIIQAAVRPAGGHFSAPVDLSAPGHDSRAPHVVINAAGDAIVVWEASTPNGESQSVEAVVRPAHGNFSVPVRLSAPGGALYGEDAALDANGHALVVWGRAPERHGFSQGNETIIQASTRPAGGSFSTPVDLTTRSRSAIDAGPVVALDPAGEAIVAWDHRTGYFAQTIQAAVRPAGGSFSAPVVLSGRREQSFDPTVAFDAAGDALALWGHADRLRRTRVNMQVALRPAGGGFSRPVDLSELARDPRLSFTDTDPATRLAVDAAGDAVAVSKRYDRRGEAVVAAIRRAGQPFAAPQRLSRLGRDDTLDPDVAIDGAGNAVAVWARDRGQGIGTVQASELSSSGRG
ncbi:MAG: hypothetical protein LC713_00230 [Actinobacteria bacterium]|nr:hypothetical protein [Actinomycetota bacterium]